MSTSSWSPAPGLVALVWVGAGGAGGWLALLLVRGSDAGGFLFAGMSVVGLSLAAVFGTRARPRLCADADGLTVRGLIGSSHHPWPLVKSVRVRQTRRLGRDTDLLEVDAVTAAGEERLVVLGRLDLGADPFDVAAQIGEIRRSVR